MAQEIWSQMLKSASNVNTLPRGTLVVLGTNREIQKSLIHRLQGNRVKESIPNEFGLGFTYIEFEDQEHYDKLSHLDIYSLDMYEDYCQTMLQSVLNRTKENVLVTVVLDWDHVDKWAEQLDSWVKFIRNSINYDCTQTVDDLRSRLQSYAPPNSNTSTTTAGESVELPLEDGQYDTPLGVDLLLCAIGSESVINETEHSDETVDFAQQFLRTIALKIGGSVVYVPYSTEIPLLGLEQLISERLKLPVHTSDKIEQTEPSIIEPDKIVVPAGWDTIGKISAVREENMEIMKDIGKSWDNNINHDGENPAIALYTGNVAVKPYDDEDEDRQKKNTNNNVPKTDFQEFLSKQHEILEKKLSEDPNESSNNNDNNNTIDGDYNVGGIQVEGVDEVLRRLKAKDVANSAAPMTPDRKSDRSESTTPQGQTYSPSGGSTSQNEVLANFFQNLLERRRNSPGSNTNSPG